MKPFFYKNDYYWAQGRYLMSSPSRESKAYTHNDLGNLGPSLKSISKVYVKNQEDTEQFDIIGIILMLQWVLNAWTGIKVVSSFHWWEKKPGAWDTLLLESRNLEAGISSLLVLTCHTTTFGAVGSTNKKTKHG